VLRFMFPSGKEPLDPPPHSDCTVVLQQKCDNATLIILISISIIIIIMGCAGVVVTLLSDIQQHIYAFSVA